MIPYRKIVNCIVITFLLVSMGCKQKKEKIADNEYYVCSMDPQVMEKQPGLCPICKMPLTKAVINKSQQNVIKLSEEQKKLASLQVDSITVSKIGKEIVLTGIVSIDQSATERISARVGGRIDKLYFKTLGEKIKEGDMIYDIYSPDLVAAQQEYLLALEKGKLLEGSLKGSQSLVKTAKNKLLLWGLTEGQISHLAKTKKPLTSLSIFSKVSGTITEVGLKEGDYATEGLSIYTLADLSKVWVEAQVYSNELQYISGNESVDVMPESYPDERIQGTVTFVNPELQENSRINLARVEVSNEKMLLKPGMQAYVILKTEEKEALVVPKDAVIRDAEHNIVWVENKDGSFEARMVETGIENKRSIEIISGISSGERVVTSGAYLLNSEFVFKRGADPMAGMNHKME